MSEGDDFELAEPEAAPRPSPWRYGWLLGALVLGFAAWQTSALVAAKPALHNRTVTTPSHLHSKDRGERVRSPSMNRDPLTRYLERAERGMTDQEIRQVLDDYQKQFPSQQLDLVFTHAPIRQQGLRSTWQREAQEAWYLQALTEALGLTKRQQEQAIAKMQALLQRDRAAHVPGGSICCHDPRTSARIPDITTVNPFVGHPASWMRKDAYAPWNLCELTPAQAALTSQALLAQRRQHQADSGMPESAWVSFYSPVQLTPRDGKYTLAYYNRDLFVPRLLISNVLPITGAQANSAGGYYLEQARLAQPAQLRMELLLQPEAVEILLAQLDGKSQSPVSGGAEKPENGQSDE